MMKTLTLISPLLRTAAFLLLILGVHPGTSAAQQVGLGMVMDDATYEEIPLEPVLMRGDYTDIPSSHSLRQFAPYVGHQGLTGTCVGWATAYAARTIVAAYENGWTDRAYITDNAYSPSFVYNRLRQRSGSDDPACTNGARLSHAMETLRDEGVSPLSAFPFDCGIEVLESDLTVAEDHRIVEYQRVFRVGAVDKIKNVRKAIAENKPVVIGMMIPPSFLDTWGTGVWEPSKQGEQAKDGHAMTVVGYDDHKYGGSFEVMNSWGEQWGEDGFVWIPYDHFADYVRYGFSVFTRNRTGPDAPDLIGEIALLRASGDTMRTSFDNGSFRVDRAYESGTQFKILLTNEQPAYLYAVGTDLTRQITRLIPVSDDYSALLTNEKSHMALPAGDDFITMVGEPGTDFLGVLYSTKEIDLNELLEEMDMLPGSLDERLRTALGDAVIPPDAIAFSEDGRLAFEARSSGGYVVPLIVAIEHTAPVAEYDQTPPKITLLSPKPVSVSTRGLTVQKKHDGSMQVLGTAYDLNGIASVHVNGVEGRMEPDGVTFRATLPPSDTLTVIEVRAADRSGNEANERFTIATRKADILPPQIKITHPKVTRDSVGGAYLDQDTLRVRGSVRDGGEVVAVYVNGLKAELLPDGRFEILLPVLNGSTRLTVRAHDAAGNVAEETRYVANANVRVKAAAAVAAEDYVLFDVFYATDRAPTGRPSPRSYFGGEPAGLSYGIAQVSIPKKHRVGELEAPAWWRMERAADPAKHIILQAVKPMNGGLFFREMKGQIDASTGKAAFVYVHGYNTQFADAARRAAQLTYDLSFDGIAAMYSWPSDGTLLGYVSDEIDVERSVRYLKKFLSEIVEHSGAEQIHLLAHSMGNRALTEALMQIADEYPEPLFTEVLLAAPDIDAEIFRNQIAPVIQKTAQRVTLYTSSNDKALMASRRLHGGRRAGDSGGGVMIIDGIDTIDVSEVDMALIGLGHSYFGQTRAVLSDMVKVIEMRLPPTERELIPRFLSQLTYWTLSLGEEPPVKQ